MSTPNKNRRNEWLAFLIIILPLFWFVPGAIYMRNITWAQNEECQSNLRWLDSAFVAYRRMSNGRFPPASQWIKAVDAYLKRTPHQERSFHCPANQSLEGSSYAMNANLSGKKLSEIKNPHNVILLYETTSEASTPFGRGEDLPRVGKETVGLGRHHTIGYRFNYYLMADGTVRQPRNLDEVKTYKWTP